MMTNPRILRPAGRQGEISVCCSSFHSPRPQPTESSCSRRIAHVEKLSQKNKTRQKNTSSRVAIADTTSPSYLIIRHGRRRRYDEPACSHHTSFSFLRSRSFAFFVCFLLLLSRNGLPPLQVISVFFYFFRITYVYGTQVCMEQKVNSISQAVENERRGGCLGATPPRRRRMH